MEELPEDPVPAARCSSYGQKASYSSRQYRVGVFGFLAHPALSAESPNHTSGNYGILDQMPRFRGQTKYAGFGGDPANVTIAGEIRRLLQKHRSPLARAFFRHASPKAPAFSRPGRNKTSERRKTAQRHAREKMRLPWKPCAPCPGGAA